MYNLREDLFERDEDRSHDYMNSILSSPSSQSSSSGPCFSKVSAPAVLDEEDDEIYFPSYDNEKRDGKDECDNQSESVEPSSEAIAGFQRHISSGTVERSEDDSAACVRPSQHVDYLSYDWDEEDIWSSWKHLMSKRRAYPNSERLENASWRTWEKKRRNLKTISPETVKWLKDHDVTWLYGPLQPGFCTLDRKFAANTSCPASNSHSSCKHRKPILKKRSLSELMLRRSVSTASLLQHVAATAEAQRSRKQAASSYNSFIFGTPGLTRSNTAALGSLDPSRNPSPDIDHGSSWSSKNVRFHELVEQCIALAHEPEYHYLSDSDDEMIVMWKPFKQQRKSASRPKLPAMKPNKKPSVSKTIEKLPHATLKCPLEAADDEGNEIAGSCELGRGMLSPCPNAQPAPGEPASVTSSHDRDGDEDEEDDDEETPWSPPLWLRNRKDSVQIFAAKLSAAHFPHPEGHPSGSSSSSSSSPPHPLLDHHDDNAAAITFELPPCRAQLNAFSFSGNGFGFTRTTHHAVVPSDEPDPELDLDDDDEEWAENIEFSPRGRASDDYFISASSSISNSSTSPSTSTLDEPSPHQENKSRSLPPTSNPNTTTNNTDDNNNKQKTSPRTSHDSGYESHSPPDLWRVRDTSALQAEREEEVGRGRIRGLVDWDLFQDPEDAWDDDDGCEAVAWQHCF